MFGTRYFSQLLIILCTVAAVAPARAQDSVATRAHSPAQTIPDTLLFKIQKAQSVITEIKAASKKGYGIIRIRTGLAAVKADVAPVLANTQALSKTLDAKNLSNYNLILNDALAKLTNWRTTLARSNNELQSRLDQVLALSSDSLLTVAGNDTTGKKFYIDQLTSLKLQLQDAGTGTSAQLDTVGRLLADVSGTYLSISNLQITLSDRVQKSSANVLQRESPYLWDAPASLSTDRAQSLFTSNYQGQDQLLRYFFVSTWDNRFLLFLLSIAFFAWVFRNNKKARRPSVLKKISPVPGVHLRPIPVIASLIVLLNLTPLFEPQSPSLYIELTQLLLVVALTVHLWHQLPRQDLRVWLLNGVMFLLLLVSNALIIDSIFMRLWLIVLNGGFLYTGWVFSRRLPHNTISNRIIRPIIRLSLVLQVLAMLFNMFGRISLAKLVSITAVIGLVQIIGLGVFMAIVLEALELQINLSTYANGLFARVNLNHTRRSFKEGLVFVSVALWLIVFFINLGIADSLFTFFYQILTRPRAFGSFAFTLGNVLSFSIIIYLSSLLQKNIGLLFGESQLPTTDGQAGQVSSILALVRLGIIVVGVLFAVAASGISIDKFTVVLGALSVGIGLGMQNIVSNFVSGIILIFEKPFQIGDYVELADRKGRIRDIGIRSSKMITGQGSEVIIPNGDLLSNRLVNWTSGNTYLKTEFTLKVSLDTDLQAVEEIIRQEVGQLKGAIQNMSPDILVTAIGGDNVELKVLIWITDIYSEASLKSQLFQRLVAAFKAANVKTM